MRKIELLNQLMNNLSYFNGISLEDFCLLASLETSELNLMTLNTYNVTPLLKQITSYALVTLAIGEDEIEVLKNALEDTESLNRVLKFCECCQQYIMLLLEEGCYHPSIDNLINSSNAIKSYNVILETLVELIEKFSGKIPDGVIQFYNDVDSNLEELIDNSFDSTVNKIANHENISDQELLSFLVNYTFELVRYSMLFEGHEKLYISKYIIMAVLTNTIIDSDTNFSIGGALNKFATLIEEISSYLEICMDSEIRKKLEKIEEGYILYIGYRRKYLEDIYLEKEMLVRCKKM